MKKTILFLTMVLSGTLALAQGNLAPSLSDLQDNGDGSYTNWFGTFAPSGALSNDMWVMHDEHGMVYLTARGANLWIYDPNVAALGFSGWIFTNENRFPYFYIPNSPPIWLVYVPGVPGPEPTPRIFLNYRTAEPLLLSKYTTQDIVDVAVAGSFGSLATAVTTADLVGALKGEGPFTVFAPTNTAFGALDSDLLDNLLNNEDFKDDLTSILLYHVIPARLTSGDLGLDLGSLLAGEYFSGYATTLGGSDVLVEVTPFGIMLDGSAMVTTPDVYASNGVIHVIDSVLIPPVDIVDTAIAADGFNNLVTAVQTANLVDTLKGDGPFTVFAPTDTAFDALGGTLTDLLNNPTALADILRYHVFPGKVYASEATPGEIVMANGSSATLGVDEMGNLTIDGATIISTDIKCANGVIHVIDAVITPPTE